MLSTQMHRWMNTIACGLAVSLAQPATGQDAVADAAALNKRLGRGINMGNMLEAPREGEWGLMLDEAYFGIIKQAGFESVRIPIRWSAYASPQPPYEIHAEFLDRVERAVDAALARDLAVVLNVHHYDELYESPREHRARFLALWCQIADHFQARSNQLCFELLNEPNGNLSAEGWNSLLVEALAAVRETNPDKYVIVGPDQWNNISALEGLQLPPEDQRLIATFHYYLPFHFTHQGASWAEGSGEWLGTTWTGTEGERQAIVTDLDRAAKWAADQGRPLYMGEFGAYSKADMSSRARWTNFLRSEAEKRGISWAYWEFASGFGAYDPIQKAWRQPLLKALIPSEPR